MSDFNTKILKQVYPILEDFLEGIAEGENLDKDYLIKKYLSCLGGYKKKRSRPKGILNGYSVFLADKDIDKKIREENKDLSFGSISQIKGKMWKELPVKEKENYKTEAKNINTKNKEKNQEEEKNQE